MHTTDMHGMCSVDTSLCRVASLWAFACVLTSGLLFGLPTCQGSAARQSATASVENSHFQQHVLAAAAARALHIQAMPAPAPVLATPPGVAPVVAPALRPTLALTPGSLPAAPLGVSMAGFTGTRPALLALPPHSTVLQSATPLAASLPLLLAPQVKAESAPPSVLAPPHSHVLAPQPPSVLALHPPSVLAPHAPSVLATPPAPQQSRPAPLRLLEEVLASPSTTEDLAQLLRAVASEAKIPATSAGGTGAGNGAAVGSKRPRSALDVVSPAVDGDAADERWASSCGASSSGRVLRSTRASAAAAAASAVAAEEELAAVQEAAVLSDLGTFLRGLLRRVQQANPASADTQAVAGGLGTVSKGQGEGPGILGVTRQQALSAQPLQQQQPQEEKQQQQQKPNRQVALKHSPRRQ